MSAVTIAETETASAFDDRIARCAESVIAAVKQDYSMQFPTKPEQQANEFAAWLDDCRDKYRPLMETTWLATNADSANAGLGWLFAEEAVWRQVCEFLLTYAVLFKAADWVRRKLGDAVGMEEPERSSDGWRIPLAVRNYGSGFGQITTDADGNVIPELTTTPDQLRQAIHDRKLSLAAAASRQ